MQLDYYHSALTDGHSKTEDLYTHVKRYRLHSALANIGVVSYKILNKNPEIKDIFPNRVNEWNLAFMAKALILNSNDHRAKDFGDKGLLDTADIYNNLWDPAVDVPDTAPLEVRQKALTSLLIRLSHQQFPFQAGIRYMIPRTIYLFEEIPNSLSNANFNISNAIKEIYGLSLKEILVVGFCMFAKSDGGYFNPDHLVNTDSEDLKKWLTSSRVTRLINSMSADYYFLRKEFVKFDKESGLEQYSFNPLRKFPLVKTQIAGIVIPVPRFVIERVTTGIFYSLMDKFNKGGKDNKFLEFFGKELFERYVGMLLRQNYSEKYLLPEWKYGNSDNRTPDWIIFEEDSAILIQCKTANLSLDAKTWADVDLIKNSLKKHAIEGIRQSIKFINLIKKREQGLEELFNVKKFYIVIVTYDSAFLVGTDRIQDLINKELDESEKNIGYEIISVDALEKLIPILEKYKLSDLINRKTLHAEWSTYDFDVFMRHFLESTGLEINQENMLLKEKYESFFKEISPRLGLKQT